MNQNRPGLLHPVPTTPGRKDGHSEPGYTRAAPRRQPECPPRPWKDASIDNHVLNQILTVNDMGGSPPPEPFGGLREAPQEDL